MRLILAAAATTALLLPTTAGAGEPRALPADQETLSAATKAKRVCAARLHGTGARGIARSTFTAPMSGYLNLRLSGARRADWDLAVFDAASGRRLGSSQAFGSNELVQTWVSSGQRLHVQGCRRSGSRRATLETQLVDMVPAKRLDAPTLVRVETNDRHDVHELEELGLDVTHNVRAGWADVVLYTAAERRALDRSGFAYKTRIADLGRHFTRSRKADAAYAGQLAGSSNLPSGSRTSYRKLADYELEMKQLAEQHPSLVKPVVMPKQTWEGRTIDGVEIGADVNRPEDGRPVYFVVGVHHAREWPSGEAAIEFAHHLAESYGSDPRVTEYLDKARVVIVPILNKDGFHASRTASEQYSPRDRCDDFEADGGLTYDDCDMLFLETVEGVPLGGSAAYRRKNCHGLVFPKGTHCELQNGVDPNRNYGEGWGGIGASMNPYAQTYRGTGPWSEPETQAVHEYTQRRQVTNLITIHNVAALVLRPPGRRADGLAPDEPRLKELGDAMAKAAGYESQYGWQLYDTSGTTDDWNYAAAGTFGYTIEIGPENGNFHMPYKTGFVDQWNGDYGPAERGKGLREALMLSLESTANPADHSVIEGSAPAGRVLRVKKQFETLTSPVCQVALDEPAVDQCQAQTDPIRIPDFLETTMVVPADGRFEYHVTPSTRPFVAARRDEVVKVTRQESYKSASGEPSDPTGPRLSPTAGGHNPKASSTTTREFTVTPEDKADELVVDLTADLAGGGEHTNPEDYDVYLSYKEADGKLRPIGTPRSDVPPGGALIWVLTDGQGARIGPNQPEQLIVKDPPVGTYVAKIVNRLARGSSWKLDVRRLNSEQVVVPSGKTEAWTLTCESADGKTVYETREVTVARGERVSLDLACGEGTPAPAAGQEQGGGTQTGGTQGATTEGGTAEGGAPAPGGSAPADRRLSGGEGSRPAAGSDTTEKTVSRKSKSRKRAAAKRKKAAKRKRAACMRKAKRAKTSARRKAAGRRCQRSYRRALRRD